MRSPQPQPTPPSPPRRLHPGPPAPAPSRTDQRRHSLALEALQRGTAFEREITEEEAFWKAQFEAAMRNLAGAKRNP